MIIIMTLNDDNDGNGFDDECTHSAMVFFNITRELSRNSQNISKRVVGWILIFLSL